MASRPKGWENWRKSLESAPSQYCCEHELHSDVRVLGSRDFGPYKLINLRAGEPRDELSRPVLALRIAYHINANIQNADVHHGGGIADEIAALVSLLLATRLRAGGRKRVFLPDSDPLGRPRFEAALERPTMAYGAWTPIIARARSVSLDDLQLLETYPQLSVEVATALVRAVRLYQHALWISESEPAYSWLFLVSAIETAAAEHFRGRAFSAVDLLNELRPELVAACAPFGDECVATVAEHLARISGAKKKFLGFIEEFLPEPPSSRPAAYQQDWVWRSLRKSLGKVYDLRSQALHAGAPFPIELCIPPEPYERVPCERPIDHEREALGEVSPMDQLPMHLHVFEHIVQGALTRWWTAQGSSTR